MIHIPKHPPRLGSSRLAIGNEIPRSTKYNMAATQSIGAVVVVSDQRFRPPREACGNFIFVSIPFINELINVSQTIICGWKCNSSSQDGQVVLNRIRETSTVCAGLSGVNILWDFLKIYVSVIHNNGIWWCPHVPALECWGVFPRTRLLPVTTCTQLNLAQ